MPLESAQHQAVAEALWNAAASISTTVAPSLRFGAFSMEDGYAVGRLLTKRRLADGDRRVGLKVGFTNTEIWQELGLDAPICAPVYQGSVFTAQALGVGFDLSRAVQPRIEPEIVFGIGEGAIEWWALGFEIVQCHYPKWALQPADAVADYGLHGALIIGEPRLFTFAAASVSDAFTVELSRDGVPAELGAAKNVLGGPLRSLERAIELAARVGIELPCPGEVVTTGTLTPAPFVAQGEHWQVSVSGADLPSLRVVLT